MTVSEPRRASLHQQVTTELIRRIVQGQLTPGTLLPPEQPLADEFGVSRIVVREAVKVLVEKGLVEVRQGRGTRVLPEENWNPLDPQILALRREGEGVYRLWAELLEARQVFEVQIAGMAALRIDEADLTCVSAHLRAMDGLVNCPDEFHDADAEFHLMLVRAAQNHVLARLIEPVRFLLQDVFRHSGSLPGAPRYAQTAHWQIFRAVEARDPDAAQQAMRLHLERTARDLLALTQGPMVRRVPDHPAPSQTVGAPLP